MKIEGVYKDHLGNVRLTYADSDGDGAIKPSSEIISEKNYYPFGLEHKGYNNVINGAENRHFTYNGKEHEESLGLDWHDYGARRYDASLGRWLSLDPLAEKYEAYSPYTYVANNPINAIDPDGRLIVYVNGLLFTQALGMKLNPFKRYRPNSFGTQIQSNVDYPTFNNKRIYYWGDIGSEGTRDIINKHYDDNKNVFANGSHHFSSQASERFELGRKAGNELIEQLRNGTIVLDDKIGETIKVVGHSQGAAHAAGILTQLLDSEYSDRLEAGIYLSPHQPRGFEHPDGVFGAQFSTESDIVSSRAGVLGQLINLFNGSSELDRIEGSDFLLIRTNFDGKKGGHDVDSWNQILQDINTFLNDDDDK